MADDEFGVRMIYPSNTFGFRPKPWLLGKGDWFERRFNGIGDWNDCPFENQVIKFGWLDDFSDPANPFLGPRKGRLPVLALPLDKYEIPPGPVVIVVSETNQSILRKRGFMGKRSDWRNVEVTAYLKMIQFTSNDSYLQFTVRGGPHHSDGARCNGVGLCASLSAGGEVILEKEYEHTKSAGGARTGPVPVITDFHNRWIGMKSVVYDRANGNPYIEFWLDRAANNIWERVGFGFDNNGKEITGAEDNGTWSAIPPQHNECGGEDNEKITWGGPGVIFKIQGINRLDLAKMSVREILPPEGFPFRSLAKIRGISFPASVRSLTRRIGLTGPHISLREMTQLFQVHNS